MSLRKPARKVRLIGAPLDLGAGHRGVDMGPSAFRVAGIHQAVRDLGIDVEDVGDIVAEVAETREPGNPRLKYLKEIRATCIRLRTLVTRSLDAGITPVVLGGDHSIAMGTIAGASRHFRKKGEKPGLVWLDAHADANTEFTSPTGNIHGMPMAVCLGLGAKDLLSIHGAKGPMVDGDKAAIIGLRDLLRRSVPLHRHGHNHHASSWPAPQDDLQHILHRCALRAGDKSDAAWDARERTLSLGSKEPLSGQLFSQLPKLEFERPDPLGDQLMHHELVGAPRGVEVQCSERDDLEPILQLEL